MGLRIKKKSQGLSHHICLGTEKQEKAANLGKSTLSAQSSNALDPFGESLLFKPLYQRDQGFRVLLDEGCEGKPN